MADLYSDEEFDDMNVNTLDNIVDIDSYDLVANFNRQLIVDTTAAAKAGKAPAKATGMRGKKKPRSAAKSIIRTEYDDQPMVRAEYCECGGVLGLEDYEFVCSGCGAIHEYIDAAKHLDKIEESIVRVNVPGAKQRFFNIGVNPAISQKKYVSSELDRRHAAANINIRIPKDVLESVAEKYNVIQKTSQISMVDAEGAEVTKKFVKRGSIKDEILAALIYYECCRRGLTRKRKDIADFMKLPSQGFSRGEDILRNISNKEDIEIPADKKPTLDFTKRYLEMLGITEEKYEQYDRYKNFIIELVNQSEAYHIGMHSQISSKVVGGIWILNVCCRLGIPASKIEDSTDNTRKNTWMKFCNEIKDNYRVFLSVFNDYKVPMLRDFQKDWLSKMSN
jgi:transcription initiation factor TFIIIB Brf1 subunit/transcription initiation factor TFIIB